MLQNHRRQPIPNRSLEDLWLVKQEESDESFHENEEKGSTWKLAFPNLGLQSPQQKAVSFRRFNEKLSKKETKDVFSGQRALEMHWQIHGIPLRHRDPLQTQMVNFILCVCETFKSILCRI